MTKRTTETGDTAVVIGEKRVSMPTKWLLIILGAFGIGTAGNSVNLFSSFGTNQTIASTIQAAIKDSPFTVDEPIEASDVSLQIENECLFRDEQGRIFERLDGYEKKHDAMEKKIDVMGKNITDGRIEQRVLIDAVGRLQKTIEKQ